jgi:hypothetical protein
MTVSEPAGSSFADGDHAVEALCAHGRRATSLCGCTDPSRHGEVVEEVFDLGSAVRGQSLSARAWYAGKKLVACGI